MKTVHDFVAIRNQIIKNTIYNKLLTAAICKEDKPVIAHSVVKLSPTIQKKLTSVGRKAKYGMAEIIVDLSSEKNSLGYKFEDFNITWTKHPTIPKKYETQLLHCLSKEVNKEYQISAVKCDPIFSEAPKSLINYLESNGISRSFWYLGFQKKIDKISTDISEKSLDEYYEKLKLKNEEWSYLNTILIALIKDNEFVGETKKSDTITVKHPKDNSDLIIRLDYHTNSKSTYFSKDCHDMTPENWFSDSKLFG